MYHDCWFYITVLVLEVSKRSSLVTAFTLSYSSVIKILSQSVNPCKYRFFGVVNHVTTSYVVYYLKAHEQSVYLADMPICKRLFKSWFHRELEVTFHFLFLISIRFLVNPIHLVSSFDKFLFIPLSCESGMHEQYVPSEMHEQEAIISMVACKPIVSLRQTWEVYS